MTVRELFGTLNKMCSHGEIAPDSEILVALYDEDGHVKDLDLNTLNIIYNSADDDHMPDWARKKVLEMIVYAPIEEE